MNKFLIEGKDFLLDNEFYKKDRFTVKSVPNNYNVTVKKETPLHEIQSLMAQNNKNLLLVDRKVYDLYLKELDVEENRIYKVDATEEFKTINGVLDVVAFLEKNNLTKQESLIVVGGGIVEDVGAFVGAAFKRGIKWIYFPTTLLSMCDSCIGGKTGINHNGTKNQLALFSAPREVIVNIEFLKTLSDFDIKSGMGEILKLLVTGGPEALNIYQNEVENGKVKTFDGYRKLLLSSLSVKRAVIEEDEFEKNYRRSLNYGHTIGHAIESLSKYTIPHGQAVIIGMVIVNKIALNRGYLNEKDYLICQRLAKELLGNSIIKKVNLTGLDKLLKKDKKALGNNILFVIIKQLGDTHFLPIPMSPELLTEISNIVEQEF